MLGELLSKRADHFFKLQFKVLRLTVFKLASVSLDWFVCSFILKIQAHV